MGVDAAAPAAEGGEGRVIDAVDRIGAGRGVAGHQLAGRAVDHLACDPGMITAPTLSWTLDSVGIDGQRADVAPIQAERALAGDEQLAGIADVEIDLVRRPVFGRVS